MYGLLSKLLVTRKLKFEQGRITAFGEPFSLVPLSSIKQMTDDAIGKGLRAVSDLYFYGWVYGYAVSKKIVDVLKLKKFEERYKITMDIAALVGFGDYKTISFKRADHAKFKVLKNPFALQYYPSKQMVDHYLRGMEAGGGTIVHEILINNIEFECSAINGNYCLHSNLASDRLKEVDKELVKSQLDLDYLLKRQKGLMVQLGDDPSDFGL